MSESGFSSRVRGLERVPPLVPHLSHQGITDGKRDEGERDGGDQVRTTVLLEQLFRGLDLRCPWGPKRRTRDEDGDVMRCLGGSCGGDTPLFSRK